MADFYKLKAGQTLTVTANEGRVHVYSEQLSDGELTRGSVTFGPYLIDSDWLVNGDATVAIADYTTPLNGLIATNAGAPADAAQATIGVNPTGDDNALTFTAKKYGTEGNNISVTYVDPSANSQSLSVSVFRQDIIVSLATDGGGSITSTAAEVKAAIEASVAAAALVTVTIDTSDTGTGDDGSGVVTAIAKTALESGAGFGIGVSLPGSLCIDTTNANIYRNDGTQAVPVWVQLGDAA